MVHANQVFDMSEANFHGGRDGANATPPQHHAIDVPPGGAAGTPAADGHRAPLAAVSAAPPVYVKSKQRAAPQLDMYFRAPRGVCAAKQSKRNQLDNHSSGAVPRRPPVQRPRAHAPTCIAPLACMDIFHGNMAALLRCRHGHWTPHPTRVHPLRVFNGARQIRRLATPGQRRQSMPTRCVRQSECQLLHHVAMSCA